MLIGSLTSRRKSDDHVTRTDVGIVNHIATFHAAGNGRVDNDRADEIAHISSLTSCRPDTDSHLTHFGQQLVGAVDDSRDHLAGDEHLVAADGAGYKDVVCGAYTKQVVSVHYHSILGNALPDTQVAGLFPIEVGQ